MIKFSLDVLIDKKVQCLSDIIKRCPRPWKNYKTYSATYKFLIQAMTFHLASGVDRSGSHIPIESRPRSAAAEEVDKPSPDLSITYVSRRRRGWRGGAIFNPLTNPFLINL